MKGAGGTQGGVAQFFVGLALAVGGAYLLTQRVTVTSPFDTTSVRSNDFDAVFLIRLRWLVVATGRTAVVRSRVIARPRGNCVGVPGW